MVGDLFRRLPFDVEPDQRQQGDQRQGGDEAAEAVAALGRFRHQDHHGSGQSVFGDDPAHWRFPRTVGNEAQAYTSGWIQNICSMVM
ncbi:hypothetical protein D3C75_1196720 [compost metagenome]